MSTSEISGFSYPAKHAHHQIERKIFNLGRRVHVFTGYGSSNYSVIIGADGYILIDSGDNLHGAEEALKEIKKLTTGPLKAVILTHSHPDHWGGLEKFLEGQAPELPIWGSPRFGAEQAGFKGLENISLIRGGRQFGVNIPDELYTPNKMVPRVYKSGPGSPQRPNNFVTGAQQQLEVSGVRLELHILPSETQDHVIVWLPDDKILFSGDTVYRSFPNLYPIRGAGYRDIPQWAAAVRKLIEFKAEALVMGHNEPAIGAEITPLLEKYSTAIQYVYDETVKGMDKGLTPDEIAASLTLPEDLRAEEYLGEYYGCIPWTVRAIFSGLLGWFDGNASRLVPLTPKEESERMAVLAGGMDKLLAAAESALQVQDYRWAAHLADYCLQLGNERAANIKADALEALSHIVLPISGKNYLMSSALELRKK